jgi:hypothetical protein
VSQYDSRPTGPLAKLLLAQRYTKFLEEYFVFNRGYLRLRKVLMIEVTSKAQTLKLVKTKVEVVQKSVNQLIIRSVAPASTTTDYLLSLLSEDISRRDTLQQRFWVLMEICARRVYKLLEKIRSESPF